MTEVVLLRGVVGSRAYGLEREDSDVDRLGVFAWPTRDLWTLERLSESRVTHNPDETLHEVAKYLRLALACNPTVLELLWLQPESYDVHSAAGDWLRDARVAFLWERGVRDAYSGYARQQLFKLRRHVIEETTGTGRWRKNAQHCLRLLRQGRELLETGTLTVRVPDPEAYHELSRAGYRNVVAVLDEAEAEFRAATSLLPGAPDRAAAEALLYDVREALLQAGSDEEERRG